VRILLCLAAAAIGLSAQEIEVRAGLPNGEPNGHYTGNRQPLLPSPLVKLPVGTVRPEGWLRQQLLLMADGFSGRLPELSAFCKYDGNAWTDPSGHGRFGWEELPYWLKGFIDLGYVLNDPRIIAESKTWIEAVLKTQGADGYFGTRSNLEGKNTLDEFGKLDLWPNMVMLYPLRTYYEATGDPRVIEFMTRYYQWFQRQPLDRILPESWQKHRGGDNLDSIYWLYNHTGDKWLLDAGTVNHERTSDWVGGIPTWHGVNISECFREPGQYYQETKDIRYLGVTERVYGTVTGVFGQVPGGLFGADENARPGFTGPRQATETCTMVELMFSDEMLIAITGDSKWADRAEDVAFNSLPAAMTPDLKALHYLTAPNQIQLDRKSKAPAIDNGGDMFSYNPYDYRCCQHNTAMGWPYFAERLWMGTRNDGLAALFYAAGSVTAKVAGGDEVTIAETTGYPFSDQVSFDLTLAKPARFPLALRIPAWCEAPRVKVNGKPLPVPTGKPGWITLEREWAGGDRVELTLPMKLEVKRWPANRDAASVHYGPLAFSLKIGERWQPYGDNPKWQKYEVFPTTAWNYALDLDSPMRLERSAEPVLAAQPFTPDAVPLAVKAKGRKIPEWRQEPNGLIGEIQKSPVAASPEAEELTLIPMGATRLRVSMFPVAASDGMGNKWEANLPILLASHAAPATPPGAAGFDWNGQRGTAEWIEFRYPFPKSVRTAAVTWANSLAPAKWRIQWWDGKLWRVAQDWTSTSPMAFKPVQANVFRLEAQLEPRRGAKLMNWSFGAATE
jgi:hypothetical protein